MLSKKIDKDRTARRLFLFPRTPIVHQPLYFKTPAVIDVCRSGCVNHDSGV
jgi:hypothetical protein